MTCSHSVVIIENDIYDSLKYTSKLRHIFQSGQIIRPTKQLIIQNLWNIRDK